MHRARCLNGPGVQETSAFKTLLFTDIEDSTWLWEQKPERMRGASARHDAPARAAVEANRGVLLKMTGDGIHAAFDDPRDAVAAVLDLQQALADAGMAIPSSSGMAPPSR